MKLKCVMFDLCGTLMDNRPALKNVDEDLNYPLSKKRGYKGTLKEFKKIKKEVDEKLGKMEKEKKLDEYEFGRILAKKLNISLTEEQNRRDFEDFYKYYRSKIELFPFAIKILDYIKNKGMLLVMITNAYRNINIKNMEALGIKHYFDYIIISDVFGAKKSELLPFKHVLEKFDLNPEECLMIGDRLDEDAYSRKVGIKFVLFENDNKINYYKEIEDFDYKIKSLEELKGIINKFD